MRVSGQFPCLFVRIDCVGSVKQRVINTDERIMLWEKLILELRVVCLAAVTFVEVDDFHSIKVGYDMKCS